MKILIVSDEITHPSTAGNRQWILAQSMLLMELGHEVHFLYIKKTSLRSKHRVDETDARKFWAERFHVLDTGRLGGLRYAFFLQLRRRFCKGYFKCDDMYVPKLTKTVESLNKKYCFDAVFVNYYWLSKLFLKTRIPLKVLCTHDCFSFKDYKGGKNAWMCTNANEEAKALQRCDVVLGLQQDESTYFSYLAPLSKIYTVYCSYQYHAQPVVGNHNILFLSGPNKYNLEGLSWFVDEVLPLIIERFADAKLVVGGGICNALANLNGRTDVELLGFVDDPYDFWARGDVAINPTFRGTGLKIKTFEAISFDKVTMVHPHSAIGIFKRDSAPLFASENPQNWADFITKAWNSCGEIESIKSKNCKYIEELNGFIKKQFEEMLNCS